MASSITTQTSTHSHEESNRYVHVSVCICTYKRPQLLKQLLECLEQQQTQGLFTFSATVTDNDARQSAKAVVWEFTSHSKLPVRYCVEPRQGIALARNLAVENSNGDYVAFIDDDEFPSRTWLLNLLQTLMAKNADGVIGPVLRHFETPPPDWLTRGKFYERPTYVTGLVLDWTMGRTNNVLVRREALFVDGLPFRPEFRSGEDQDYFRRAINKGRTFVWCNEAKVFEVVTPNRWRPSFMMKRALLQGAASTLHEGFGRREIAKSLIAVPLYSVALPFAFLSGQHRGMALLVKLADHSGRLLALLGLNPIREQYVVE